VVPELRLHCRRALLGTYRTGRGLLEGRKGVGCGGAADAEGQAGDARPIVSSLPRRRCGACFWKRRSVRSGLPRADWGAVETAGEGRQALARRARTGQAGVLFHRSGPEGGLLGSPFHAGKDEGIGWLRTAATGPGVRSHWPAKCVGSRMPRTSLTPSTTRYLSSLSRRPSCLLLTTYGGQRKGTQRRGNVVVARRVIIWPRQRALPLSRASLAVARRKSAHSASDICRDRA